MLPPKRPGLRRSVDVDDTQRSAMILADARIKKPTGSRSRRRESLVRRAQVHVAAFGLDVDVTAAVA
jgi:hypothetical protein